MVLLIPGGLKVHIEGLWKRIKEFKELSCLVKVEGSCCFGAILPKRKFQYFMAKPLEHRPG